MVKPKVIVDTQNLITLCDKCIEALRQNSDGSPIMDLALFLNVVGEATENFIFEAVHQPLGYLGNELVLFFPFVAVPVLPNPLRDEYRKTFEQAVETTAKCIEELKYELCISEKVNCQKILEACGKLINLRTILSDKRRRVERTKPPLALGAHSE